MRPHDVELRVWGYGLELNGGESMVIEGRCGFCRRVLSRRTGNPRFDNLLLDVLEDLHDERGHFSYHAMAMRAAAGRSS